ncbi:MAG: hypothetical protein ACRD9W_19105 [Terriglobia bacterium]
MSIFAYRFELTEPVRLADGSVIKMLAVRYPAPEDAQAMRTITMAFFCDVPTEVIAALGETDFDRLAQIIHTNLDVR